MDTALPQKFPFILDSNLEKANCTEDRVCTSCDKVVLVSSTKPVITYLKIGHFQTDYKSINDKMPREIRRIKFFNRPKINRFYSIIYTSTVITVQ